MNNDVVIFVVGFGVFGIALASAFLALIAGDRASAAVARNAVNIGE